MYRSFLPIVIWRVMWYEICNHMFTFPGCGDYFCWPVRPSLFPNIPPYIRFSSYDANAETEVPNGKKFFKWKLSTITPVIVRKTLTNSGFALVRSEFSRGVPPIWLFSFLFFPSFLPNKCYSKFPCVALQWVIYVLVNKICCRIESMVGYLG